MKTVLTLRILLTFLSLALASCGISKGSKVSSEKSGALDQAVAGSDFGSVTVGLNSMKIFFKLELNKQINWDVSAKGKMEWEWRAQINLKGSDYLVGFSRSSRGGNSNSGTLSELIAAGNTDIRIQSEMAEKADSIVTDHVEIALVDEGLLLEVSNEEIVELIKNEKPEKMALRGHGVLQKPSFDVPVVVKYE